MKRPKITPAEVAELIKASGETFTESVYVVAIRGYYKNSMGVPGVNDRGIYDDAMVLVGPNYFQTFNANTDPSKHKFGIGTVAVGLHFYKKGKHGISGPKPYDAFRPDTPDEGLPGHRDGQTGVKRIITPNLHSGGTLNTNSAACQTVFKDQWLEFQKTVYKMMSDEGQRRLPYLLIENK
ncbi:MAG: hypothetical protein RIQ89_1945 [Bacteroidota bacterium]|jgi:lysozyme